MGELSINLVGIRGWRWVDGAVLGQSHAKRKSTAFRNEARHVATKGALAPPRQRATARRWKDRLSIGLISSNLS
eukprot:scaffold315035_cov28-Tisochrysis_lutea.AAC.3